jgi:hypothetical protein
MRHEGAHLLADPTGNDPVVEDLPGILDFFPVCSVAFQLLLHKLPIENLIQRLPDRVDSPVQVL